MDEERVGGPVDRDRDAAGRPQSRRPRDAAGRPLGYGSQGVPRLPDDLVLPPEDALAEAQRLIDAGRPFHAHEVLEAVWKTAAPEQRDLWRGLAQLAVGLTHLQRGNRRGAVALLRRGADLVGSGPPAYGVATERLADEARRLAAAADRADDPSPQARLDLRPAPSGGLRPSLDDDREPGEEVGE